MSALIMENVSKTFGRGDLAVPAVREVSFSVKAGEVLVIMGPSGSGKTSLLAMAGCLLRPDSGRILLGGLNVTTLGESQLPVVRREKVGFIFQSFNLISALTARENVELVLELSGRRNAATAVPSLLQDLGLAHRAHALPRELSGGERQRVAIARALATEPAVILADEPTANLDSRSGQQVMELLSHAARGRRTAVIIVSHDNRVRHIADRVLWMEDGRLRAIS